MKLKQIFTTILITYLIVSSVYAKESWTLDLYNKYINNPNEVQYITQEGLKTIDISCLNYAKANKITIEFKGQNKIYHFNNVPINEIDLIKSCRGK